MRSTLHLTVPNPCQEKWDSFQSTQKGGFCSSCQKEVIDFSKLDDEQVKAFFKTRPAHVCGRFKKVQLKSYVYAEPSPKPFSKITFMLMGIVLFFYSRPVVAQKSVQPMEQREPDASEKFSQVDTLTRIRVAGVVRDDAGLGMPGVRIRREGTEEEMITDVDGKFVFEIKDSKPTERLTFGFVGYLSEERLISRGTTTESLDISLKPDIQVLGEVMMIGAIGYRKISPRKWWWKFRSLFW